MLDTYTVIVAEPRAIHAHCVAIICGEGIIFECFRFIFFHSDTHFVTNAYSFTVEFLFCCLSEIDECFFGFVEFVVIVQIVFSQPEHSHRTVIGNCLFIPFHCLLVVFHAWAISVEIIVSHFELGICIVCFGCSGHIFYGLVWIFFYSVSVFISQSQFCNTTGFIILFSFVIPFECFVGVFLYSDSVFVATANCKHRICISRLGSF